MVRGRWGWSGAGMAAVVGWLVAFLAGSAGEGRGAAAGGGLPAVPRQNDEGGGSSPAGGLRAFLGRLVEALGEQGTLLRERVEGLAATYRLLRAMGMTDQQIAALVTEQVRTLVVQRLGGRVPEQEDLRRLSDALFAAVARAAEDVDQRFDLGGDFVRQVRDLIQAARAGREDALRAFERGSSAARALLERLLAQIDGQPAAENGDHDA
jgi:hypothetical protein